MIETKKIGTNRKLWIIGDSFTGNGNGVWIYQCIEEFKGDRYYVSSRGSRDVQTIIDIFLRKLHLIEPHDFVILMLPSPERVRLPLLTPMIDIELTNEYIYSVDREKHLDYFIGSNQYEVTSIEKTLEPPLTGIEDTKIEGSDFELNINLQKIINSSKANIKNISEILKSLQIFVYFDLMIVSWSDAYEEPIIGRNKITEEVGFWESLHQLWQKTEGKEGRKDDFHWSPKMHEAFANYVMKKYPKYFNI